MSVDITFKKAVAAAAMIVLLPTAAISEHRGPKKTAYEALNTSQRCLVDGLTTTLVDQRKLGLGIDPINGRIVAEQATPLEIRDFISDDHKFVKHMQSQARKLNKQFRHQGWGTLITCVR